MFINKRGMDKKSSGHGNCGKNDEHHQKIR